MRRLLLLVALGLAFGCTSPAYVIENSELPVFLGDGDLLTARRGKQEVNVRHIREDAARLQQTWLDPLSPDERSFRFDPTWGRILSVGRLVKGVNPLRSGSPHQRDRVQAELFSPDTVFSLRSWPGGDELVSRQSHPGLAQTPDGNLVLRRSREAQFELYDTASGAVVASGPARKEQGRADDGADLTGACFTGPRSFAFAWQGTVYRGELVGNSCAVERFSAGSSLAYRDGRLYVLVKNRWLRAFDLESKRPLWQIEVPKLEEEDRFDGWSWKLTLSPTGNALAVEGRLAFVVADTRQGKFVVGPQSAPPNASTLSLSLGTERCAALYSSWDTSLGSHTAKAWDYGSKQGTPAFERHAPVGAQDLALSADGQWLAISAGSWVEVWRVE